MTIKSAHFATGSYETVGFESWRENAMASGGTISTPSGEPVAIELPWNAQYGQKPWVLASAHAALGAPTSTGAAPKMGTAREWRASRGNGSQTMTFDTAGLTPGLYPVRLEQPLVKGTEVFTFTIKVT